MPVASPSTLKPTTLRPVPKPSRKPAAIEISRLAAHRLVEAQGFLFNDIAADLDASQALEVAENIDRQRDPLLPQMVRLFRAIRHDLNISAASRAMAVEGERCGLEAIRLDRIKDEHDARAKRLVLVSIEHGHVVVASHEALLTGHWGDPS